MRRIGYRWPVRARLAALAVVIVAGLLVPTSALQAQEAECWTGESSMGPGYQQWSEPPQMIIDEAGEYTATIETNRGTIVVDLLADQAPLTVNNFVCLALAGFYDVTVFHRIILDFMIQGGDPTGTGTSGPGYQFADELPEGEAPYVRGAMAMANSGPNTNGSQFFIVHADQPSSFPANYSLFGQVIEGIDVVDTIAAAPVVPNARGETSSPLATLGIKSITIRDGSGAILGQEGAAAADAGAAGTPAAADAAGTTVEADDQDDDDSGSEFATWTALGVALVAALGWFGLRRARASNG